MPVLHLLPWCRLDREYTLGRVALRPIDVDNLTIIDPALRTAASSKLSRVLDITAKPVSRVTMVCLTDKDALAEFSAPEDWAEAEESVDLACFSGLARRDFLGWMNRSRLGDHYSLLYGMEFEEKAYFESLNPTPLPPPFGDTYCNADCFVSTSLPFGNQADVILLRTRRRDQFYRQMLPLGTIVHVAPAHVNFLVQPGAAIVLDEALLSALGSLRARCKNRKSPKKWQDWYDAIGNFNQANSDNSVVSWQTEWVLMCSAFRRVLVENEHRARPIAREFGIKFLLADPYLSKIEAYACELERWLYDFHFPRNDFAHGRHLGSAFMPDQADPQFPIVSLLIAAILFPLLVRSLLFREGLYNLTDLDRCMYLSAAELIRRFPAKQHAPINKVRQSWMALVTNEYSKLAAVKSDAS